MPKIIENAKEKLIEEAKAQIAQNGYESVTIRSISRGCGIGLGTFYNYFKSKDMLIATFLLENWTERIKKIAGESERANHPMEIIELAYSELCEFILSNERIFNSSQAIKAFNNSVFEKHKILRDQLAEPICSFCVAQGYENAEFLSQFCSEAIITWSVEGKSFDEFSSVIEKLFIK